MRTAWIIVTTAGLMVGLCLVLAGRPTQAQGPGAPAKFGVVDLGEVLREYQEVQEMEDKLRQRAAEFKKEGEARRDKLDTLRFERDRLHPDEPEWLRLQKELNRMSVELELWAKFEKQDIEAESREQQSRLYKRALQAVETVAKQRGLASVFQLDEIDLNDPKDVVTPQRMSVRAVLYASPAVDLTKDVIAMLNQASK